jgi:hypothetical protein
VSLHPELLSLLDDCLVQVNTGRGFGTGFFVAPRHVLTCAHVVVGTTEVDLRWRGDRLTIHTVTAVPERPGPDEFHPLPDLAMIITEAGGHPWVALGGEPGHRARVTARGFSRRTPAPGVALDICPLDIAGPVAEPGCLSVAGGSIPEGMSGSPVLDETTGLVCGLVKASRNREAALGGWVVSVGAIRRHLPQVVTENAAHPGPWRALLHRLREMPEPDFYRRALAALGVRRPDRESLADLRERAFWTRAGGDAGRALDLYRELVARQPDQDPVALLDQFAVAELLTDLGDVRESRRLLTDLVPALEAALPTHPDTVAARIMLSAVREVAEPAPPGSPLP